MGLVQLSGVDMAEVEVFDSPGAVALSSTRRGPQVGGVGRHD